MEEEGHVSICISAVHAAQPTVVIASEVALPRAVVLVSGAVVLDAVKVGGLRHIGASYANRLLVFSRHCRTSGSARRLSRPGSR